MSSYGRRHVSAESTEPAAAFLDLLDEEAAARFRERARPVSFAPGEALVVEHEAGDRVLVIERGRVKVSCTTADGKEMVLRFCGPGDLIGEMAVIEGEPRSGTVVALEAVEALALPASSFLALIESEGGGLPLLRLMARRFRDADRKRIEFGASDSVARVAARLVELAERYGAPADGPGTLITLPLSQEELAGWTGSSLEAVAKALQALRELGWIETGRRQITVLDLAALRERAA